MNSKIVKGILLMVSVIFAALQSGNVVWAATIITTLIVGIGYFVKNVIFPSVSDDNVFDWRDVVSTLILSALAAIEPIVGSLVTNGAVDWLLLGKTILTVVIIYFSTTFFAPAQPAVK
jgi:hypothetical protein